MTSLLCVCVYVLRWMAAHSDAELAAYWIGVRDYSPADLYDLGPLNRKNMVKHFAHVIFWVGTS